MRPTDRSKQQGGASSYQPNNARHEVRRSNQPPGRPRQIVEPSNDLSERPGPNATLYDRILYETAVLIHDITGSDPSNITGAERLMEDLDLDDLDIEELLLEELSISLAFPTPDENAFKKNGTYAGQTVNDLVALLEREYRINHGLPQTA